MKRFVMLAVLLSLIGTITFGDNDLTVVFNNSLIPLNNSPIQVEGDFMLPIDDVLQQIGVQYAYDPSAMLITAYHDNMFLKYYLGSRTYYLNGKSMSTLHAPMMVGDTIYLPLSTLAEALSIQTTFVPERQEIRLDNYALKIYKTHTSYFYRHMDIPEYNVSLDIPYYWERLDEARYSYGIQSEYENNQVTCYAIKASDDLTIDAYAESLLTYLRNIYPEGNLVRRTQREYQNNGFRGLYMAYTYQFLGEETVLGYYVTQVNDLFYILNFTFNQEDANYLDTIVENIILSFESNAYAVNPEEEHFVEYPRFYDAQMKLSNEFYSNQQFREYIPFAGNIDPAVTQLDVTVGKDSESIIFSVPVTEGSFNERIYLPFGLGKHNLSIAIHSEEIPNPETEKIDLEGVSNQLMRFSVINISPTFLRYTIPDGAVITDHTQVISMANFLTYDQPTDYAKAYQLFLYLLEHVQVRNDLTGSDPYEVYLNLEGTDQGVTYYYASLLRGIGIPTRVYRGTESLTFHYWTEIYLNGSWSVVDPAGGILALEDGDPLESFLIRPEVFRERFTDHTEITQ